MCKKICSVGELGFLTKSLERKPPTSSVVDGPPMFMNTIAVGPLDPVGVAGGVATEARVFLWCCHSDDVDAVVRFEMWEGDVLFVNWVIDWRSAILSVRKTENML